MRGTGELRGGVSQKLLQTVTARSYSGTVYRVIGSRFLQSALGSAGSKLHGGRFNPPGTFEVLYTAVAADTAIAEREGFLLTSGGIKVAPGIRTSVVLRIECRLKSVLDLTDESVRRRLHIPLASLLSPWLPWNVPVRADGPERNEVHAAPSQRIGVAAYTAGRFEAILSPSAKDAAGRCLAIFPERLQSGSSIAIDDPDGTIRGALGITGL